MKPIIFFAKLSVSIALSSAICTSYAADLPLSSTQAPPDTATPLHVAVDVPLQPDQAMISILVQKGIIKLSSDNTFRPGAQISRGEFTDWLFKASDLLIPFVSEFPFFRDVPSSYAYYHAVEAMRMQHIVDSDDGAGNFHPDKPMLRGDAGVLLSRTLPNKWLELTPDEVKETLSHIQKPVDASDQNHLARSIFAGFLTPIPRYLTESETFQSAAQRNETLTFNIDAPISRMDAARMVYQRAMLSEEDHPRAERETPKLPAGIELVASPTTAVSASQLFVGQVIYFSTIENQTASGLQIEIPRGTRLHSKVVELEKRTDGIHARIVFDKAILPSGDSYLLDGESFLIFKPDKNKQAVIVPGENIHVITGTQVGP